MQVAIRTTSQLGNTFYSYIPFSWIIYEQTELLLRKHLDEKDIKGINCIFIAHMYIT